MKRYTENSPQAISRILSMFMIGDGMMDPRELESFERLGLFEMLKLTPKAFWDIFHDYCDDLTDEASDAEGRIHPLEKTLVDGLLADITDHRTRLLTCAIALDLCKSDEEISEPEMALLQHMMKTWDITLDSLEREFLAQ